MICVVPSEDERFLERPSGDFHLLAVQVNGDRLHHGGALPGRTCDVLKHLVAVDLPQHRDVRRRTDSEMSQIRPADGEGRSAR